MASYLLDTNVLLRLADRKAPEHGTCLEVVEKLRAAAHRLIVSPQVVYEFWVVATRGPEINGFGWPCQQAANRIRGLLKLFPCLNDPTQLPQKWLDFVARHNVQGKKAHDARLVVFADLHGVDHLLTLNGDDFHGWEISVKDPRTMR